MYGSEDRGLVRIGGQKRANNTLGWSPRHIVEIPTWVSVRILTSSGPHDCTANALNCWALFIAPDCNKDIQAEEATEKYTEGLLCRVLPLPQPPQEEGPLAPSQVAEHRTYPPSCSNTCLANNLAQVIIYTLQPCLEVHCLSKSYLPCWGTSSHL